MHDSFDSLIVQRSKRSRIIFLIFALTALGSSFAGATQDFSAPQPPVACAEDLIPHRAPENCPDLSKVTNPWKDWPIDFTEKDKLYWQTKYPQGLSLCRADEIQNREKNQPTSQPPLWLELATMKHRAEKVAHETQSAVRQATFEKNIPYTILIGALTQESLLADLGLTEDGGNFSCGIGQLNLREWCNYAQTLDADQMQGIQWNPEVTECNAPWLQTTLMTPYLAIARKRLGGTPDYKMEISHLQNIAFSEVATHWPKESAEIQSKRFSATRSFAENCMRVTQSINAKAAELQRLFYSLLPPEAWSAQSYETGESYLRNCREPYAASHYPLHAGWLTVVGVYNAGGHALGLLKHYYQLTSARWQSHEFWARMTPQQIVDAYFWGGKTKNTNVFYTDSTAANPQISRLSWFKACVLQRHIARVVQHVTIPGNTLAQSLDSPEGCAQNTIPPQRRRISSGVAPSLY